MNRPRSDRPARLGESGVSLLLVMVLSAVAAIVMLGTMSMLSYQRKQIAVQRAFSAVDQIESQIRNVLQSPDAINRSIDWRIYSGSVFDPTRAFGNQALERCVTQLTGGASPGVIQGTNVYLAEDCQTTAAGGPFQWGTTPGRGAIAFGLYSPLTEIPAPGSPPPSPIAGGNLGPINNPINPTSGTDGLIRLGPATSQAESSGSYVYYDRFGAPCGSGYNPTTTEMAYRCPIRARAGFYVMDRLDPAHTTPAFADPPELNELCPANPGPALRFAPMTTDACLYFTYDVAMYGGGGTITYATVRPRGFDGVFGALTDDNAARTSVLIGPYVFWPDPGRLDLGDILNAN